MFICEFERLEIRTDNYPIFFLYKSYSLAHMHFKYGAKNYSENTCLYTSNLPRGFDMDHLKTKSDSFILFLHALFIFTVIFHFSIFQFSRETKSASMVWYACVALVT